MSNEPYEVIASKGSYTQDYIVPAGYKAIYVLVSNLDGAVGKPFYVGQTLNIQHRFSRHEQIAWYWNQFGLPVKIMIVSVVKADVATEAEQSLIADYTQAGYRLSNKAISDKRTAYIQAQNPLLDSETIAITQYFRTSHPVDNTLDRWQEIWFPKSQPKASPTVEYNNDIDSLFLTSTGSDIRKHPHYVPLSNTTTAEELMVHESRLHHSIFDDSGIKSPILSVLIQKIASLYNPERGYSRVTATELAKSTGIAPGTIGKYLSKIDNTGMWAKSMHIPSEMRYYPIAIQGVAEAYFAIVMGYQYYYYQYNDELMPKYKLSKLIPPPVPVPYWETQLLESQKPTPTPPPKWTPPETDTNVLQDVDEYDDGKPAW